MFYYSVYMLVGMLFFLHAITSKRAKNFDKIVGMAKSWPITSFIIAYLMIHVFPVFVILRIKNTRSL